MESTQTALKTGKIRTEFGERTMLDLIKYIVNQFAEDKENVEYTETEKERVIEIVITLPSSDMGKVIGKQGKIAKAMRTIVRAATPRNSKRYVVEIREKDGNAVDTDSDETEAE